MIANVPAPVVSEPLLQTHAQWAELGGRGVSTLMDDPTSITREQFNEQMATCCSAPIDQLRRLTR